MSDLTDAIRWWDHWVKPSAPSNELTTLVAAARLVAEAPEWLRAMLENPPDPGSYVLIEKVDGEWPEDLRYHLLHFNRIAEVGRYLDHLAGGEQP